MFLVQAIPIAQLVFQAQETKIKCLKKEPLIKMLLMVDGWNPIVITAALNKNVLPLSRSAVPGNNVTSAHFAIGLALNTLLAI